MLNLEILLLMVICINSLLFETFLRYCLYMIIWLLSWRAWLFIKRYLEFWYRVSSIYLLELLSLRNVNCLLLLLWTLCLPSSTWTLWLLLLFLISLYFFKELLLLQVWINCIITKHELLISLTVLEICSRPCTTTNSVTRD